MKSKLFYLSLLFFITVTTMVNAQSSANENKAREWIVQHEKELNIKPYHQFKLAFVRKSLAGETLRFQQMVGDVPVFQSEIVINFNPSNELAFSSNSYDSAIANVSTTPSLSKEAAQNISKESLKIDGDYSVDENNLYVTKIQGETKLVYRVITNPVSGVASWETLIDAQTGAVLSTKDVAIYHHKEKKSKKNEKEDPKKEKNVSYAPVAFTSGTAMVYLSDPLSYAQVAYGATGYTDGNDANTTQLAAARTSVVLPEIDFTAGVYKLKSSFAEIAEFESPNYGLFTQATPDFNFTRDDNAFEAANVFYHVDHALRYINVELGIPCLPQQNSGVLQFDSAGLSGADNSHFIPSTDRIAFGEGCVDDAEDADVIWHEFGHGVHDWITNGNTSPYLGEGNGDYWAQSYSRSLNQWNSTQAAYHYMFSWDGHNTCWSGRTTNYTPNYPAGLVGLQGGAAHTDGQIWATALMRVWNAIGREKTDKAFLEGLALTNSSTNQQNAAIAVRQAAINMNFPCADITAMTTQLASKGYTLPALTLTMAAIADQTVTADSNNTYTIPDYATLANPISQACAATLTQSPTIGNIVSPGTYTITMTATLGTETVVRTFTLTVLENLATNHFDKNEFQIYPNPANSELTIKGEKLTNETVSIFNVLGQKVIEKSSNGNEIKINVSHLSEGVYTIQFKNSKATQKFIKK